MYKILIKKQNTSRNLFEPYMEDVETEDVETSTTFATKSEWETNDLDALANKYKALLASYTTSEIKVIQVLDARILVEVEDK